MTSPPPRGQWDVTYLGVKYPWLRVDREALEEFRSPFRWDSDVSPHSPAVHSSDEENADQSKAQRQRPRKGKMRDRGKEGEIRRCKRGKRQKSKTSAILRNHEKLFSSSANIDESKLNNVPRDKETRIPPLRVPIGEVSTFMPILAVSTPHSDLERLEDSETDMENLKQDHQLLAQLRKQQRKSRKRKKPINLLAFRFPVITPKPSPSASRGGKMDLMNHTAISAPNTLLDKYSQQIKNLASEEQRLQESVIARIAEQKARLPLTFLFERNLLRRSDAQQDGLRIVTAIFAKLQHRLLFNSYIRWKEFVEDSCREDRKRETLRLAQQHAVALLERVSSDAYVGSLDQGFQRWKTVVRDIVKHERHTAARAIQNAVRARRSRQHLEALRQAAEALDHRRNQAIQALLRFEEYGTRIRWRTLRVGFDIAQQNQAARKIQQFVRRVIVRRRIALRAQRRKGSIQIQTQWRAYTARQQVAHRRAQLALRFALESKAAIQMQRAARGFLARNEVYRQRIWLAKANSTALHLQRWLRHRRFIAILHAKFRERKQKLEEARARAAAEELARFHWKSAIAVQCVLRGLFARKVYARRLIAHRMEQAAIYLQRFYRRRRGLYALGLRFAERRERIAQRRLQAAIMLQCAIRCFEARRIRSQLAQEKERRRRASTVIQRHVRGSIARNRYRSTQRAMLVIQCSIRCALSRRRRARRYDAVHQLQNWVRRVYSCRTASQVLNGLRVEAKRREDSVVLIQKLVRQHETQTTARLFREALSIVKTEQRRYFGSESGEVRGGVGWVTHQASSELLTYVTERFLEDNSCFTTKELKWLREQVQAGHERLAHEDHAAVYLQRRYRGYATRMAHWVHRKQVDELRRVKEKNATLIQSWARRWLAKRYVRRVREQRRLAELKETYIRERKRKEEEKLWKEQYDREQMELCVKRAQEAANQLREARREADLARVKAEAAEYRAKELAAEREIESLLKTPVTKKADSKNEDERNGDDDADEKDPWVQLTDDYGNVYYYNESTGESSWDPPPPRQKKAKLSPEDEVAKDTDPEGAKDVQEEKPKEIDPLEEVLREGKCIKCQRVQSSKRCLDCEDAKRAFYCTACFKQHTSCLIDESLGAVTTIRHDFEVVRETSVLPARCESAMECSIDGDDFLTTTSNQEPAERCFAAYFCSDCIRAEGNSDDPESATRILEADNGGPPVGCFYCESCFARDHETTKKLRHVDKVLRFRRGALLCCDCGHLLAVRQCDSCGGDKFCESCFISSHTGSKRRTMDHMWIALDVLRDLLEHETDTYCIECDVRASSRLCNLCGDGFCDGCFDKTHAKGAKRRHTWLPWSVAAQHGDWIEIKDEKATIYFNVETKESTTEQPTVLLSGEERHRLQLAEREQLQRSRQVELESEVVKLKEQLRELQVEDRPRSRARTPGGTVVPHQNTKTMVKPAKRGVLSRLFGRKPPQRAITPDERQQIAEELANRVRAEKQPVSSPIFQQAMVHELAALAVTSPGVSKPK
ncbi:unnamed protein product [Phytophthora fragariaefolia]|uniref:Unnamed protein product n=1 Tax=Phytophthora fragariaefolia TaxID=1490495 RepID=A0A9W6XGP7_9STRA|nr:unnamed protein product [Phytophthora fragariaefolia]